MRYIKLEPVEDTVVGVLAVGIDDEVPEDDDETVKRGVSRQLLNHFWKTSKHRLLRGSRIEAAGRHTCVDVFEMKGCSSSAIGVVCYYPSLGN